MRSERKQGFSVEHLRKGEVLANVGRIQNLKGLKHHLRKGQSASEVLQRVAARGGCLGIQPRVA